MKYVKLIATGDSWFIPGTEVYQYDLSWDQRKRLSLDEWNEWLKSGMVLVRGQRICESPESEKAILGEEYIDGESCSVNEFVVKVVDEEI